MKYVIDVPEEMITSSGELRFHYKNTKDLTYQMYTGINVIPYTEPDKNVKNNNVHLCNSCVCNFPDCPALEEDVLYGDSEGFDNICCCPCYIPKNYYNPESKERKVIEDEVKKNLYNTICEKIRREIFEKEV